MARFVTPAAARARAAPTGLSASPQPRATAQRAALHAACACGGHCPACLSRKAAASEALLAASPGSALGPATRRWMEQRFGHGFGHVRVHADSAAQSAAQALHTRAFAVGQHIAFAAGQYDGSSASGRRLLAHELAHTVQQRLGGGNSLGGGGGAGTGGAGSRSHGESAAEAAAQAVLSGRPVPAQPHLAPGVQRDGPALPELTRWRPRYSEPPTGDYSVGTPTRVNDDEYTVPISTGQTYRVRRVRWTSTEDAGSSGRAPHTRATPGASYRELWFTVEWCQGASEGTIRLSADAPEQALRAAANAVLSGGDIDAALAGMAFTPQLQANFQVGTVQFRLGAQTTINTQGQVNGARGSLRVETNVPGGRLAGSISAGSERSGDGALPPPSVDFGLEFRPGASVSAPACRVRHRTRVVRHQRFDCHEIIQVPERRRPVTEQVPDTERRTRYLYFPYASSHIDGRRSAAQQALIQADIGDGFSVASVAGYASPEGSINTSPGFEGNTALSQARAQAARRWLAGACSERGAACLPDDLAAGGESERHTLFEPGPDGAPREVEGARQSDHAAGAFAVDPSEADQRSPGTDTALARAGTPSARAAVVYPQLRRVNVTLVRTRMVERQRVEVTPATSYAQEMEGPCPTRLHEAAFPPGRPVR